MVKPRLKDFLPNIFSSSSKKDSTNTMNTTSSTSTTTSATTITNNLITTQPGRLETDALPVDDTIENNNGNRMQSMSSVASTPTASADLTESVVRELSNPNYNSMEVAQLSSERQLQQQQQQQHNMAMSPMTTDNALTATNNGDSNTTTTMNTMNVHNAQQQLVMQFSNVNKLHIGSVFNFNNNLSANASSTNLNCSEEAAACGGGGGAGNGMMGGGGSMGNVTPSGSMSKRQTPRKTVSIVGMMQSQEEPNTRMLDTISTHLGEGWKDVMRKLGHSDGQIEQAIIDHQMHGGIKEVIYQLLLEWVRNADDGEGTLGNITTLLWECNQRDCVQRMKLVWKAEVKRKISN